MSPKNRPNVRILWQWIEAWDVCGVGSVDFSISREELWADLSWGRP